MGNGLYLKSKGGNGMKLSVEYIGHPKFADEVVVILMVDGEVQHAAIFHHNDVKDAIRVGIYVKRFFQGEGGKE